MSNNYVRQALLEDWSTLKQCNSIIFEEDLVEPSSDFLEGFSQQIKCKFSNLYLSEFLRLLSHTNYITSIGKITD